MAQAQADLGSCSGVVTDETGAVIANAEVTLTNVATGAVRTTVTNSKGEYSVTQLLPAAYSVKFGAEGFSVASHVLQVTVGSSNTVNVKLAVKGESTQITVTADDFAGVHLEKPEVAAVIQTDQILSLPTLDRNPYNLVAISGNLSSDPNDAQHRGVGFNISGSRSTSVDILLDGVENTDLYAVGIGQTVPMDATSEIRIVTSNSGAEYGRGQGAVNVSTSPEAMACMARFMSSTASRHWPLTVTTIITFMRWIRAHLPSRAMHITSSATLSADQSRRTRYSSSPLRNGPAFVARRTSLLRFPPLI